MLGIVVSEADEASMHVREQLLAFADWQESEDRDQEPAAGGGTVHRLPGAELRTFAALHLELEGVAERFSDPSVIAFASRHSGESGPLLTAHHTGNVGPAEFGGRDRTLARAAPGVQRRAVASLASHAPAEYDVGIECTHHGPSDVGAPSLFVEVGSGPEQWADPGAAGAVARAILSLRSVEPDVRAADGTHRHVVGFGGGHYAPRFERILRETDWGVGHVAADWALEELGDPRAVGGVIEQAFTTSRADRAILADERPDLAAVIEDLGHRVVGETWLRESSGVALDLVAALEDTICPVDAGLRFGRPARGTAAAETSGAADDRVEFVVGAIPGDLTETASGIDRDATLRAVDEVALAYDTEQSGSVVGGTVAVGDPDRAGVLIDRLAGILEGKYDSVRRSGSEVVARTEQFAPELAREAGVTPGPAFGRLADGEPVTVDGETVRPETVTETIERRLPATLRWRR